MFEMGASDMIKKLLPIVDNFERGFNSISEEEEKHHLRRAWIWSISRP